MSMYRFCGASTEFGDFHLKRLGQSIELNDKQASEVILGGAAIVPADHPAWKDLTEQELSLYADPVTHGMANGAFLAKKRKLQLAAAEIRTRLEAGEPLKTRVEPVVDPKPVVEPVK